MACQPRATEGNDGLLRLRLSSGFRSGPRGQPLVKRKEKLKRILRNRPRLLYVDYMQREGLAMFAGALALGLEGIVAKDSKSPTSKGRA